MSKAAIDRAKTLTRRAAAAATLVLLAGSAGAQAPAGIAGVVAPGVEPELVQEGFVFTEGPVAAPDGGLYFSDIRPNRIYRLDPSGKTDLVREQTNGANGLAVTAEDRKSTRLNSSHLGISYA